jgi:hypothetical protein
MRSVSDSARWRASSNRSVMRLKRRRDVPQLVAAPDRDHQERHQQKVSDNPRVAQFSTRPAGQIGVRTTRWRRIPVLPSNCAQELRVGGRVACALRSCGRG